HVREVARAAGYRLNLAARSLRTRRTQMIAVVVEKLIASDRPIADPLLLLTIGGLLEGLTPAGYALLLTTSDYFLDSVAVGADGVRDVLAASPAALVATIPCEFSRSGGVDAVAQSLAVGLAFDAVIATSDYIAAGACEMLMDRGVSVPGQIAVIGFDDNVLAAT